MGIPLALALLMILFHQHNYKLSNDLKTQLPILHARTILSQELPIDTIQFGVLSKSDQEYTNMDSWIFGSKRKEVQSGILDITADTDYIELHLQSDIAEFVTIYDLRNVLQKAITTLELIKHMEKNFWVKAHQCCQNGSFYVNCCFVFHY